MHLTANYRLLILPDSDLRLPLYCSPGMLALRLPLKALDELVWCVCLEPEI